MTIKQNLIEKEEQEAFEKLVLEEMLSLAIEGLTECIVGCDGIYDTKGECFPWVGQEACKEYLKNNCLCKQATQNVREGK